MISHLKEHQTFPATKEQLVETCNNLSDFSEEDKKWFMEKLPEGTYKSPEEVAKAVGMNMATMQMEDDQQRQFAQR